MLRGADCGGRGWEAKTSQPGASAAWESPVPGKKEKIEQRKSPAVGFWSCGVGVMGLGARRDARHARHGEEPQFGSCRVMNPGLSLSREEVALARRLLSESSYLLQARIYSSLRGMFCNLWARSTTPDGCDSLSSCSLASSHVSLATRRAALAVCRDAHRGTGILSPKSPAEFRLGGEVAHPEDTRT